MKGPLSGIRIIDLSRAAAGPYGVMLLADLGAEVIKIEAPGGDVSRHVSGPTHKGESYLYMTWNRNKKSIELNLETELGKQAVYDLVKISDVLWDNFRPGSLERLGLDYQSVKKTNPRLICCSITGFGSSGPYRNRPSWDPTVQGLSGLMSVVGEPDRPPVRPGPPIADLAAGLFAALGVMAALVERESTGVGQRVEVSMLDACVSLLSDYIPYYFCGGGVPKPLGSGHLSIVPFGAYPTKQGYLALGPCWPRICRVLAAEHLVDDPRFKTRDARAKHRDELSSIITELLSREKAEDWLEVMYAEDIAAAPVNTIDKAVIDPQVVHNNMVLTLNHPLGGEVRLAGNPVKMPSIDEGQYVAPSLLGQHSQQILADLLGYPQDKIERLGAEVKERAKEVEERLSKAI